MNINSSLVAELRDKEYRDAYVESQIRMLLPLQVRELRKRRDWTQPELADKAGMGQPRISELEKPGERRLTIETLLRLASAFDIGLQVRFLPLSELMEWSEGLDVDRFDVPSFETELKNAAQEVHSLLILRKPPQHARASRSANGANQGAMGTGESEESQRRVGNMPNVALVSTGEEQYGSNHNCAISGAGVL